MLIKIKLCVLMNILSEILSVIYYGGWGLACFFVVHTCIAIPLHAALIKMGKGWRERKRDREINFN